MNLKAFEILYFICVTMYTILAAIYYLFIKYTNKETTRFYESEYERKDTEIKRKDSKIESLKEEIGKLEQTICDVRNKLRIEQFSRHDRERYDNDYEDI